MLLVALFLFIALWNVATVEAGQLYELCLLYTSDAADE